MRHAHPGECLVARERRLPDRLAAEHHIGLPGRCARHVNRLAYGRSTPCRFRHCTSTSGPTVSEDSSTRCPSPGATRGALTGVCSSSTIVGMMATAKTTTGTLKIGDQWNAITIIAHSQTHPLKAICELAENAIDAGSRSIRIVRRRSQRRMFLEVEDDGRGVAPGGDGQPDFERIATHLCDSMKRHLDTPARRGVHGEFGIGLLSFWSLGEELRMTSGGGPGAVRELHLERGKRQYTIRPVRGRLAARGTRVLVGPLLEATKNLVTGEKIARYLSAELRDRIRNTGVTIDVVDTVARRETRVVPREFDGERLEIPRRYATPLGDVGVELYLRGDDAGGAGGIALCKDGTRVIADIAELLPFQHAPWTDRRLEGLVDFEALALAPGTRSGIVPDAALDTLAAAAPAIEADIAAAVADREQAEAEAPVPARSCSDGSVFGMSKKR
ncbi:MAG: hypothetical protein EBS51_13770 [Planctomycetia bacterium]|nr:hypothetical protein [Planctomycetia bacterium]